MLADFPFKIDINHCQGDLFNWCLQFPTMFSFSWNCATLTLQNFHYNLFFNFCCHLHNFKNFVLRLTADILKHLFQKVLDVQNFKDSSIFFICGKQRKRNGRQKYSDSQPSLAGTETFRKNTNDAVISYTLRTPWIDEAIWNEDEVLPEIRPYKNCYEFK